ncbi:alkaline phosphatase family protein [Haloarchaeobius amylolyticus]|uniref:alkaline phosphatase family protein n=1 Tax=Haloarchaeobius amylolyticus TaxID=1198296 RepID=UPI0022710399|nr:nucleotide pyrophosphatase/phosphodiesterase family protein [Haloarchaeobius amylolyticus]
MLRSAVAAELRDDLLQDGYLFPDYDGYCFGNLPHSLTSLFGVDTGRTLPGDVFDDVPTDVENVLVVLVDGFGWAQWQREREHHRFLGTLSERARVTPLTSIYPSETAAAITTFHTGALAAEHGVVGWNVFDPEVGRSYEALPFHYKDGTDPEFARDSVANADSLYTDLAAAGVDTHHVVPFPSVPEGVTRHQYESLDEVPGVLDEAMAAADGPAYHYLYLPHVDHEAHQTGTRSTAYRETVGDVFETVQRALSGVDDQTAAETLLVLTADHGHVDTDPDRNVDLDGFDWLVESLARDADDAPVRFAGSPRNVHLYLSEGASGAVATQLRAELDARVFDREEVLQGDLFGDVPPSEPFQRRLGDLVLTHRDLGTWWGDHEPDELGFVGMHGGMHPDEMLTQVAVSRLSTVLE